MPNKNLVYLHNKFRYLVFALVLLFVGNLPAAHATPNLRPKSQSGLMAANARKFKPVSDSNPTSLEKAANFFSSFVAGVQSTPFEREQTAEVLKRTSFPALGVVYHKTILYMEALESPQNGQTTVWLLNPSNTRPLQIRKIFLKNPALRIDSKTRPPLPLVLPPEHFFPIKVAYRPQKIDTENNEKTSVAPDALPQESLLDIVWSDEAKTASSTAHLLLQVHIQPQVDCKPHELVRTYLPIESVTAGKSFDVRFVCTNPRQEPVSLSLDQTTTGFR